MIVVVAPLAGEEASCRERLAARGAVAISSSLPPAAACPLLLVDAGDEAAAERLAADLRDEGIIAMVRPEHVGRLAAWERDTQPVTIAGRVGITVAWSAHARPDVPVTVELGHGGFGHGEHPTTRLLVEELLGRVAGGERVLDVGCGSGVLGLVALRLGAAAVVALDLKPSAVAATARNAALNGVADRLEAVLPPLDAVVGRFDVIVANVGRSVVVDLAAPLVERLAPGGWLAVSGISPSQATQVAEFLAPLVEVGRRVDGEWAAVVLAHPAA